MLVQLKDKIKSQPYFYVGLIFFVLIFLSIDYLTYIVGFIIGSRTFYEFLSAIALPIFLSFLLLMPLFIFQKLFIKLFVGLLLLLSLLYYSTRGAGNMGAIIIVPLLISLYGTLILIEHYREKIISKVIFGILLLILIIFLIYSIPSRAKHELEVKSLNEAREYLGNPTFQVQKCNEIGIEDLRHQCYFDIIKNSDDPSICSSISDAYSASKCFVSIAYLKRDLTFCEKAKSYDESQGKECVVTINKRVQKKDEIINECSKLGSAIEKNECLSSSILKYGIKEDCIIIDDSDTRRSCEASVSNRGNQLYVITN